MPNIIRISISFIRYQKGFTLVELIVTIAIIGILASVAAVSFRSVQQKSRDADRKADLSAIQSALEQYKADNNYYPPEALVTPGNPLQGGSRTYLKVIPQDPSHTGANNTYRYEASTLNLTPTPCDNGTNKCVRYCISARLELPDNPTPTPPPGCSYGTSNRNYIVTQP